MRGRHTAAILEQIGCHELVTETLEGYVQTSINLANDLEMRKRVSSKIRENLPRLYHDAASTRQLEKVMRSWLVAA
jgi:predicted O-linked N-acetylglucosamine transferase (SPINDLY family)